MTPRYRALDLACVVAMQSDLTRIHQDHNHGGNHGTLSASHRKRDIDLILPVPLQDTTRHLQHAQHHTHK